MVSCIFYYAVTTARKLNPTCRGQVGDQFANWSTLYLFSAMSGEKMQTSLVTRSAAEEYLEDCHTSLRTGSQ